MPYAEREPADVGGLGVVFAIYYEYTEYHRIVLQCVYMRYVAQLKQFQLIRLSGVVIFSVFLFTGCAFSETLSPKDALSDEDIAGVIIAERSADVVTQLQNTTDALEQEEANRIVRDALQDEINQRVNSDYVYPIAGYTSAVTKKTFGQYINAENSPIENDRFTGFHTGDDVEVLDVTEEVPFYALSDATVVAKRTVNGYGGVVILEFTDPTSLQIYHALYGHVDITSVEVEVGDTVTAGQELGVLGDDASKETDGERKHLHFSLYPYSTTERYAGYVNSIDDLKDWIDPAVFLQDHSAISPIIKNTSVSADISKAVTAASQNFEE